MTLCKEHPTEHKAAQENVCGCGCADDIRDAVRCPVCLLGEVEKAANVETWARLRASELAALVRDPMLPARYRGLRDSLPEE